MHAIPEDAAPTPSHRDLAIPRSVVNLWHCAQISHRDVPSAEALWSAFQNLESPPNR